MKTNKLQPANIKAKIKFYLWLVSIGSDLRYFDPSNLQIHEIPPKQKSSFKKRSQEIKQKYNHVFATKKEENFLSEYPNIESITFNRKIA
jgi:hypothetical protein